MTENETPYTNRRSKVESTSKEIIYHQGKNSDFKPQLKMSTLRHELRTPLNAVVGYSEMLLEDAHELGNKKLISCLQKIKIAGQELNDMVNHRLDTSDLLSAPQNSNIEERGRGFGYDVRMPLNTIIDCSAKLQEEYDSNIIANFHSDLNKIKQAAETFQTHTNLVFDNSRAKPDKTNPHSGKSQAQSIVSWPNNELRPNSGESTSFTQVKKRSVLVVDDNRMNRDLLSRYLSRQGLHVITAKNGMQALEAVKSRPFDLILLDVLMPEINGYQALKRLKSDKAWRDIPVIMISALKDMEGVIKCIELGADDYLPKPFNPVVLKARINNCLERKRLSDIEKEHKKSIKDTFGRYVSHEIRDEVLSGRIPVEGEKKDVTVLFADLRDFTPLTESMPPKEMVKILNGYFTEMAPAIRSRHGSILQYLGDEIYAVFGAPTPLREHPRKAVAAALDMRQRLVDFNKLLAKKGHSPIRHGIGIHSGPVVAANIGSPERLTYGLVGDTVNVASRIQGLTKKYETDILVSAQSKVRLEDEFTVAELPPTFVKGKTFPTEIFKVL